MDKKNLIIGILLLAAAAVIYFKTPKPPPQPPPARPATASSMPGANKAPGPATSSLPAISPGDATFSSGLVTETADAQITTLANDYIEARFTNHGGAIVNVAFKKYPADRNATRDAARDAARDSTRAPARDATPAPFVFNEQHIDPIFAFTTDAFTAGKLDRNATYKLVSSTPTEIVFSATIEDGPNRVEVRRKYTIAPAAPSGAPARPDDPAPYIIHHEVTFTNLADHTAPLPAFAFNIGTAALVNERDTGQFLAAAHNDGDSTTILTRSKFGGGSGFLGMNPSAPLPYIKTPGKTLWAAISNQFFTGILTPAPNAPGAGTVTHRVELPPLPGATTPSLGLSLAINYETRALAPGAPATLAFDYYAGPKEYTRIRHLGKTQDDIMQYSDGWYKKIMLSGFFAPLMNTLMNYLHRFLGNWGLAIIGMTLLIKIVTMPLMLASSRTARRMQKIQPELQAVKEKFKDNPQKQQQATMEIFKKHKINPMAGCIPALITMPLFIGFFSMLQNAAELRFQTFLWARDLSAPDTIGHLPIFGGIPLNIFPLIACAAMLLQMQLVPQPTTGGSKQQMAIMRWGMPLMMFFFWYSFSCALALYSTVNNLYTAGQQLVINRFRDTGDPADPANKPVGATATAGTGQRPMKNVTPAKKKF